MSIEISKCKSYFWPLKATLLGKFNFIESCTNHAALQPWSLMVLSQFRAPRAEVIDAFSNSNRFVIDFKSSDNPAPRAVARGVPRSTHITIGPFPIVAAIAFHAYVYYPATVLLPSLYCSETATTVSPVVAATTIVVSEAVILVEAASIMQVIDAYSALLPPLKSRDNLIIRTHEPERFKGIMIIFNNQHSYS